MADSLPLVLWDCSFNPADVAWQDDAGNLLPQLHPYNQVSHPQPLPISSSHSQANQILLSGIPRHSKDSLDLFHALHKEWTQSLIRTSIATLFLQASCTSPPRRRPPTPLPHPSTSLTQPQQVSEIRKRGKSPRRRRKSPRDASGGVNEETPGYVYDLGGGETKDDALYVPLLQRERGATVEEINSRWKNSMRGQRNMERMTKKVAEKAEKLT